MRMDTGTIGWCIDQGDIILLVRGVILDKDPYQNKENGKVLELERELSGEENKII